MGLLQEANCVRICFMSSRSSPWSPAAKRRSKAVMDKCYAKCIEFGGQVSGEHAIGHAKKQYLVESAGETAFGLMQAIKQVFDPKGILNPGKVCTNVEEG